MSDLLDKSKSYVLSQLKRLKSQNKEERRGGKPFVTISRQSGAYGMTMAEMLAEYLQKKESRKDCLWTIFDKNIIQQVIVENQFPEGFEKYFLEKPSPVIEDTLEEMFGIHPVQETLVHKMNKTIFRLAQLGYVILIGRGTNIITRTLPKGVHIRLIGSLEKRIRHMQDYLNLTAAESRGYVLREEESRRRYIKKYFNKDTNDPSLYDLVINTDTVPLAEAVHLVGDLVLRGQCDFSLDEPVLGGTKVHS